MFFRARKQPRDRDRRRTTATSRSSKRGRRRRGPGFQLHTEAAAKLRPWRACRLGSAQHVLVELREMIDF